VANTLKKIESVLAPYVKYPDQAERVKMSSINHFESNTLPELLSLRSQIDARVSALCGGDSAVVAASSAVGAKVKKPSARAGKPTAYGAFSSKIQKENADEIKAFKEANPEMKGAHMAWVGKYKEEHPDIYEAFKTEWAEAHPKPAAPAAAVEGAEGEEAKPKKVLTPEHLAKMKAGREAAKAAKAAAAAGAEPAPLSDSEAEKAEKPKRVLTPEHLAKLKAGREAAKALKDAEKAAAAAEEKEQSPIALMPEAAPDSDKAKKPKKAKKAAAPVAVPVAAPVAVPVAVPAAVPVAAPAPVPVAVAEEAQVEAEELPFKHGGAVYIRMGISNASGEPKWASNDLWMSKKGARGPYAGELMEDGSINADAEEPAVN
jgi:hypothetical protein